jgi:hypothetical protein
MKGFKIPRTELNTVHLYQHYSLFMPNKLQYSWRGDYCECVRPTQIPILTEVRTPSLLEQYPRYVPQWDRAGCNIKIHTENLEIYAHRRKFCRIGDLVPEFVHLWFIVILCKGNLRSSTTWNFRPGFEWRICVTIFINGIVLESEFNLLLQYVIIIIIIITTTIIMIITIIWGRTDVQILYAKVNTCTYQTTQLRMPEYKYSYLSDYTASHSRM